jgi:hypothetical protein
MPSLLLLDEDHEDDEDLLELLLVMEMLMLSATVLLLLPRERRSQRPLSSLIRSMSFKWLAGEVRVHLDIRVIRNPQPYSHKNQESDQVAQSLLVLCEMIRGMAVRASEIEQSTASTRHHNHMTTNTPRIG